MRIAAVVAAVVGWTGLTALGIGLYQATPRQAGFDLELVLEAGRRWFAGAPLYPSLGTASATDLFYSYPPPVAQAASLISGVPTWLVLLALALVAVAGVVVVATRLATLTGHDRLDVALIVVATLPLVFPFAIGLLFGNLDVLVPAAFGAVLVALSGPSMAVGAVAGLALALVAVAKVYPGLVCLWLVVRMVRSEERAAIVPVVVSAIAGGVVVLGLSLLVGGAGPWADWLRLIAGSGSVGLLDVRNIGPAALVAGAFGLGESGARVLQVGMLGAALVAVLAAARLVRDPVASFTVAAVASTVVLPITWLHYAAALIPSAIAYALRARMSTSPGALLVAAAVVDGVAALLVPALAWLGVAALLAIPLLPSRVTLRAREATA